MSTRQSFRFKQFQIYQDQTAMKVSLDACVLGAVCQVDHSQRILDIGAGTGLLSLMLAQRSQAQIDAVEIDEQAFFQAQENINLSPFSSHIHLHKQSIQAFSQTLANYDTIICNPPFFSDHLLGQNQQRNLARHNHSLTFQELTQCMAKLLSQHGQAWLLLPQYEHLNLNTHAELNGLFVTQKIDIQPRENKPSKLSIWVYTKQKVNVINHTKIMVYDADNQYTQCFKNLLHDYYLKL